MKNSEAYNYLVNQLNSLGPNKSDFVDTKVFEDLLPVEREYIEERIVNSFVGTHGDYRWADFMPLLEKYDGVEILKQTIDKKKIPSTDSLYIALSLLKTTGEEKYIDIIKQNIEKAAEKKSDYICILSQSKNHILLQYLVEIYIYDEDEDNRNFALDGILFNYGVLNNIFDLKEYLQKKKMIDSYKSNDIEERKANIDSIKN